MIYLQALVNKVQRHPVWRVAIRWRCDLDGRLQSSVTRQQQSNDNNDVSQD